MNDLAVTDIPEAYEKIKTATAELQFDMASDLQTGSLLKTLVAAKPGGRFLELGTGTGLATSWIATGMNANSSLTSVDNNDQLMDVARKYISDQRIELVVANGYEWIPGYKGTGFDLIFADAIPGKYDLFEETICMLNQGGIYVIDDMLPQPNWPAGHEERVNDFIEKLEKRKDLQLTKLNWSTGIIIVVKK